MPPHIYFFFDEKGIIEFQELLLHDPALLEGLNVALDEGIELIEAIQETFQGLKKRLQDSQNQYIAARAADCEDLEKRLTTSIISLANPELDDFYDRVHEKIIFCQQILPSEVVMLHRAGVRGIISMKGTASSHAQILMKCFGIPSLSCIENFYYRGMDGVKVLLDTRAHKLIINPKSVDQQILSRSITQFFSDIILEPIHLPNGEAIEVLATINNIELDATRALGMGADGVGLFRSEMTYIGKAELPNENELYAEYFHLTNTFQGKPVTMRMLDLGGDKLAGFQTDDLEENPSMGNRSMRLLLTRKDIFRTQLRAMLRAANDHTCILFPMISGWDELIKIHAFIDKQKEELIDEGYEINPNIQYGLMIEVPSLVEKIEDFVKDYSVFNIGSNDLTQYTLAADRNNRSVSDYYKYSHPSIISMISKVSKVYSQAGKRASMCGEMAYNLELLPLLIGLGIRSFSVSWDHIAELKSAISNINIEVCQKLTVEALNCRTQSEVEQVLGNYNPWPEGY